jgi:hypothetical protein
MVEQKVNKLFSLQHFIQIRKNFVLFDVIELSHLIQKRFVFIDNRYTQDENYCLVSKHVYKRIASKSRSN